MRLEGLHRRRAGRRGCHAARRHPGFPAAGARIVCAQASSWGAYELTSSFIKPRLYQTTFDRYVASAEEGLIEP